jgi:hypothetical protein
MALLIDKDYTARLKELSNLTQDNIIIFSAYIKTGALEELAKSIPSSLSVKVISRWKKGDLVFGASDLEVYEVCKKNGWEFGIDLKLHGKLYLFDSETMLLGSANLTGNGLSLWSKGNIEFGVEVQANKLDVSKLNNLLQDVVWLDDDLYQELCKEIEQQESQALTEVSSEWSEMLSDKLKSPINYLWQNELVLSTPSELLRFSFDDEVKLHDYDLLGLDISDITLVSLKNHFKETRVFSWIKQLLKSGGDYNFGRISSELHNSLLDDSVPYRSEVKEYVNILFEWFKVMNEDFVVTKYSRTSSVKLI